MLRLGLNHAGSKAGSVDGSPSTVVSPDGGRRRWRERRHCSLCRLDSVLRWWLGLSVQALQFGWPVRADDGSVVGGLQEVEESAVGVIGVTDMIASLQRRCQLSTWELGLSRAGSKAGMVRSSPSIVVSTRSCSARRATRPASFGALGQGWLVAPDDVERRIVGLDSNVPPAGGAFVWAV